MNAEHLVTMANDIAAFFATEPEHEVAVAGVRNHIQKYWDPRMRRRIAAHLREGGAGLSELARAAVAELAETSPDPA